MSSETPAAVTDGTAITQPELAEALDHELDSCWVGGRELASNVFYYLQQKRTHTPADAAPPVAAALDREALSAALKRRGMTEREVQDVLGELGSARPDIDRDPMWHRAYMDVEAVLNQALGTEEEDGLGSGVAADVALLAQQRDEARAKLAAITDACRSIPTPIANRLLAIIGEEESRG